MNRARRSIKGGSDRSNTGFRSISVVRSRGTELKFWPQNASTSFGSVSTAGTFLDLAALIAEGSECNQRVGRSIRAEFIDLDVTIEGGQSNLATDDSHNTVRVAVVMGEPTAMSANLISFVGISTFLTTKSVQGLERIFYDKTFDLVTSGRDSTGYLPALHHLKVRVPVHRLLQYIGAAGNTISFRTIGVYMVSDSAVPSHPGLTYGNIVLSYVDA